MTIRLFLAGERVGAQLSRAAKNADARKRAAERGAAQDVVDYVVPRGRDSIAKGGNFKGHWQTDFKGKVTEGGGFIRVNFTHADFRWGVFEYGAIIKGRPLLWIPLSFAKDAQGVRARDYPGKLFRVDRKNGGAPLLMSRSGGGKAQAKYFGKPQVRIPRKWHLRDVIRAGANKMRDFYAARMKKSNG